MPPSDRKVWLCLPSASPQQAAINFPKWKAQGYNIACLQDRIRFDSPHVDLMLRPFGDTYQGYYTSANHIIANVLSIARLIVCAGDDMTPDPNLTADQIADQFDARFPDGFGVMQPTGDQFGIDHSGRPAAARICGSPFIGIGFAVRAYGGRGPWPAHYRHFYGDEELLNVTQGLKCLWQRPDLTHYHDHWSRRGDHSNEIHGKLQPYWDADKASFMSRLALNFPGHAPLAPSPEPRP